MRRLSLLLLAASSLSSFACSGRVGPAPTPSTPGAATPLPVAYMVGETTSDGAVLWVRCEGGHHAVAAIAPFAEEEVRIPIDAERDFTGRLELSGLTPDTRYRYTLWCRGETSHKPVTGSFRTAPEPRASTPARFAWGGDVGGQNVCRDATRGYLPFYSIFEQHPQFFVALGDMIYADDPCKATGRYGNAQVAGPSAPAADVDAFRAHWRYGRADTFLQRAFGGMSVYAIWDDHEIANDAGPQLATLPAARQAFYDYHPFPGFDATARPLYRNLRWGRHLELFILDARSYRAANGADDRSDKSLLGAPQKEWLLRSLQASDATWKVIVSSVPIGIPTGGPQKPSDSWADGDGDGGFEHELTEIFTALHAANARNVVFLTTDVHFATALRYRPLTSDDTFVVHEFVSGPLQAGVFPRDILDPTFRPERLFLHQPGDAAAIASYDEALTWFNFGVVDVDDQGVLTSRLVDATGKPIYEQRLEPAASTPRR